MKIVAAESMGEIAVFEYRLQDRTFRLHRTGCPTERTNRNGNKDIVVEIGTLELKDKTWVLELMRDGSQLHSTVLLDWRVINSSGLFTHPDDPSMKWTPDALGRNLLTDTLKPGSYHWVNNLLVVRQEGYERVEEILAAVKAIPWRKEGSPDQVTAEQTSALHRDLRGVQDRKDELTKELRDLGAEVDAAQERKDQESRLIEEVQQQRKETNDKVQELDKALKAKQIQLQNIDLVGSTQQKVYLLEEIKSLEGIASHYRAYHSAPGNQDAVDREPREACWGDDEEVEALKAVHATLSAGGRSLPWLDLLTLHLSLMHAPFTILQGAPGAGKTSALQLYAQQMGMCCDAPIAVSPAWTTQEDVIGYYDMLAGEFVAGELGRILLAHHGPIPYLASRRARLAILDEINLVTVEHAFSALLSALSIDDASQRQISIHRQPLGERESDKRPLPLNRVTWPSGLILAGTANDDHTVNAFSDRFRDRSAIHTVRAPSRNTILTASLTETPTDTWQQPARDLKCETWNAWKLRQNPAPGELVNALEKISAKIDREQLSIRSFRRGATMARHAHRLIGVLPEDVWSGESTGTKQAGKSTDLALLAASLGLMPTLIQRTVHLQRDDRDAELLINELQSVLHPALHPQLEALKA